MPATLDYTVQTNATGAVTLPNLAGYRLRVSVTGASGMSGKPFVFQAALPNATASGPADTFYTVASAGQLAALPADAPASGQPFYRLAALDLVFESEETLREAQASIEFMLAALVRAVNELAAQASPVARHLPA
jgi:hypothetical protein